jgi:amino acid transporter
MRGGSRIRLLEGVAVAVASTAPAYTIDTGLGLLALLAGQATDAALLLAALPVTGIAWAFRELGRHEPHAGVSYAWVGRAFRPGLGFLNGWLVLAANLMFLGFTVRLLGVQVLGLAHPGLAGGSWRWAQTGVGAAILLLLHLVSRRGASQGAHCRGIAGLA